MMSAIAVAIHVLFVFWLVSGVAGRGVAYARARRAQDLGEVRSMVGIAHAFEMGSVRPATFAVLIAGLIAAWARGRPILGFLQGAQTNWVLVSLLIYLTLIPLIVFVFVPRGKVFRAALDGAVAEGRITPALTAALSDPAVAAARAYEQVMIVVLTFLMVVKPF